MIGIIKVTQSKNLESQNTYIFKFSKTAYKILDKIPSVEVKIINSEVTLYKPTLSSINEYKVSKDRVIKVSTKSAYIDITGLYYIEIDEDDSQGYTLNRK